MTKLKDKMIYDTACFLAGKILKYIQQDALYKEYGNKTAKY
ncbi:hypothetical protein [Pedobacter jejuensis]|nr:hypothetical protein [Pedobacter jejuensis]